VGNISKQQGGKCSSASIGLPKLRICMEKEVRLGGEIPAEQVQRGEKTNVKRVGEGKCASPLQPAKGGEPENLETSVGGEKTKPV